MACFRYRWGPNQDTHIWMQCMGFTWIWKALPNLGPTWVWKSLPGMPGRCSEAQEGYFWPFCTSEDLPEASESTSGFMKSAPSSTSENLWTWDMTRRCFWLHLKVIWVLTPHTLISASSTSAIDSGTDSPQVQKQPVICCFFYCCFHPLWLHGGIQSP